MLDEGFRLDKWGYEIKTYSGSCLAAINSYNHQVISYGRDRSVILEAPKHDPCCVLGNILAAHYLCSRDPSLAPPLIEAAKSNLENASLYERSVFQAVNCLILPNRDDDLALELHSQVLPANKEENYIYGMLAFPLLELGLYDDAEKAAKKGFEINSSDTWTQHALCHVYQYHCHFKEAVQFMEQCSSSWITLSSFMYTHNWWHVAVCYLEGHSSMERVRKVYDLHIWKELERSDAMPGEVYLNAAALLLRIYLRGAIDVFDDRLKILADRLTDKRFWHLEWHLDVLTLWVLACTGELSKAEDLLDGLKSRLSKMSNKKKGLMQRAMQLAEALFVYGKGDSKGALDLLEPEFDAVNYKIIGASDEQVDVFNELWIILLLNNGQSKRAIEAIEKQLKKRKGVVSLWHLLERGYKMNGRKDDAIRVGERARTLGTAHFNS
ncbi:unnamed protein product [Cuscuta europaea]|uniref:Tetratricopeptide repeat protein 38 n=1 Tax=Cuscuta europaea TaxID=41803 RepID=A0A9P0ZDR0_CUSEU|nr:unnamed protein product [Cuscuta europaea]